MQKACAWLMFLLPAAVPASDQHRLSYLEQEVRNLQRQVLALTRQIEEMRLRQDRPPARAAPVPGAAPAADPQLWIDAARWRQVRPGMSEFEVIELLGPPTSMREQDGARLLLYALEIGASGFLGGSIVLRDRAVVDVRQPTLQ
jgi:hypothetical protein